MSPEPLWWPPTKVAGRHLGPWLAAQEGRASTRPAESGLDIERALPADSATAAALARDPSCSPDGHRHGP